ncbi:MAG TPA: DUF4142 domain-containing protein [Rhodocyclaceae bacterium]|nr:DUF4142 domain-containing protein [Rhodocyclaceae bacterium]
MALRIVASCVLASSLALGAGLCAAAPAAPDKFLTEAIQDGRAEIEICKVALRKSKSADVKEFAQRMIKEHSEINDKVEALAKGKGITLKAGISAKQKATNEMLSHTPEARFDKAFMDHNVSDHKKDVEDFGKQANEAADGDVKAFAAETLQILKKHLQLAEDVGAKLKE